MKHASPLPAFIFIFALLLVIFGGHIFKYYIAPRDGLAEVVNRCELEANRLFLMEITKWIEEHHTDVFNPFRRKRDEFIETCVKAENWCALTDDSIWPASRPWAFAPKDRLARWIYDLRYEGGEHLKCYD